MTSHPQNLKPFLIFLNHTSSHQVDGFQNLERPDLPHDCGPFELGLLLGGITPDAPYKVRLGVDEGPEQVVQSCVEVLGQS